MVSLKNSKLFHALSVHDLEVVRGIAMELPLPAGYTIFREDDVGDAVYVIKDGAVEIRAGMSGGKSQVVSKLGPGEFFGEMSVIEFKRRSASAITAQPTTVYKIPAGEMFTFLQHCPELALTLLREVSSRLRDFHAQYVNEIVQAERLSFVGRFARSIVHDLKNPLNIIGLTAEIAGSDNATPEFRKLAATRIRTQVERISELIGEILEFTQGTSTTMVLVPIDYAEFVRTATDELHTELESQGVILNFENAAPAMPLLLDPARLRRVFYNLTRNALEMMPAGGIVTLRFTVKPKEVETEIEDTGPGIPAEIAPKLFEPFATFGKKSGTGLGLSISKRIIEDHGGRIWARTEPGRGAVFTFTLPRPN